MHVSKALYIEYRAQGGFGFVAAVWLSDFIAK